MTPKYRTGVALLAAAALVAVAAVPAAATATTSTAASAPASTAPVPVPETLISPTVLNGSFEADTGTLHSWGPVSAWAEWTASEGGPSTSGWDSGSAVLANSSDGARSGFLQRGNAAYNLTDRVIGVGDTFVYRWDWTRAHRGDATVALAYRDDAGDVVAIPGTETVSVGSIRQLDLGTSFTAEAGDPWIGHAVGLVVRNGSAANGYRSNYPEVDNFRLSATAPAVTMNADFETGTLDSGIPGLVATGATAPDAAFLAADSHGDGSYAIGHKVVLDDPAYTSADAARSESDTTRVPAGVYRPGDTRRYEFSFQLKDWEDWKGVSAPVDIVWQFKRAGGGPNAFVAVKRNSLVLRYENEQINLVGDLRPYDDQWIDVRFDIRWSSSADGYMYVYARVPGQADYTLVHSVTDAATWEFGNATGTVGYLKWGLYRPDSTVANNAQTRVVYHDDIRVLAAQ